MEAAEPEAFPAQPPGGSSVGPDDAATFFRQLGEQTSKVLTAAEEAGRGIREQARRDAAGIIAEARVQANELALAAASQRRAAEEELRRFREARTILANQIEDVHRRLEEIILRLRTPVEAPEPASPPKDLPPALEAVRAPVDLQLVTGPSLEAGEAGSDATGTEPAAGEARVAEGSEEGPAEVPPVAEVLPLEQETAPAEPAAEPAGSPGAAARDPAFGIRAQALDDA
ncbi:MAG TPA: hypothetical protein VN986_01825, partial [Actinomycetota bacterium]|nr:hypothetical protein [Actinomycetota bacterium]